MAILDVFKKDDAAEDKKPAAKTAAKKTADKATSASDKNHGTVIVRPLITEKATVHAEANIYTFEVAAQATKPEIAKAVRDLFGVTPTKVNIVNLPDKAVYSRRNPGVKAGKRKALVYLKQGETIEFV